MSSRFTSDKRVEELKKLTDDLEIQGSAQDNAIYELAHGISEVESSIQRELELFKHQFDEARTRFTENSKRVRENDDKMQDELDRFEREERRLTKIKMLNTELRAEKERIELKKKDMMKVLDGLKEELSELKSRQNVIDIKRQEINKEMIATRQRKNERFTSKHKIETLRRDGETLISQSEHVLEEMDKLEQTYKETFDKFMVELDENNDIVHNIRDRIGKLESESEEHQSHSGSYSHDRYNHH